jgi:hypothetical protein
LIRKRDGAEVAPERGPAALQHADGGWLLLDGAAIGWEDDDYRIVAASSQEPEPAPEPPEQPEPMQVIVAVGNWG